MTDQEQIDIKKLLQENVTALNDWLHSHAPDLCHETHVIRSRQRTLGNGGVIAYVAALTQKNLKAIRQLEEKDE